MDKLDLKLISELENNARQTLSQIAKKIKTSQQVISYRIKSLEERKIITEYYTIINFTNLNYTSYRTMIRLSNINKEKHKEIIDYLIKCDNVLWLVECGGRWDLIVNFIAKNIIQYNNIIKKEREVKHLPSFGGEHKVIDIDKTNLQILNLISENARMSSVEISQKLKISPNTIILRIKEMKKLGIIQSFKPLIHLENTSYHGYKALVKFQNITETKEIEIINYLKSEVNIVGIIKLIGLWDFEIEFEVKSKEEMLELTRSFRDRFKKVIKDFEVVPLFHEYKYNFFPRDLLK